MSSPLVSRAAVWEDAFERAARKIDFMRERNYDLSSHAGRSIHDACDGPRAHLVLTRIRAAPHPHPQLSASRRQLTPEPSESDLSGEPL